MSRVAEVLKTLQEERRSLALELSRVERAITALEAALEPGELAPPQLPVTAALQPQIEPQVEPKPYASLRFHEAAVHYLAAAKEPKTTREIADALLAGGFPTRSRNFASSARTMLGRIIGSSEGIEQTDDGRWRFIEQTPG
jgi:hypothetical protein